MIKLTAYLFMILALLAIVGLLVNLPEPPKDLQIKARQALHDAKLVKAEHLAPGSFREANMFFDSAMTHWGFENEKFVLFRDYTPMKGFLEQSLTASRLAYYSAKNEKEFLKEQLQKQIENLEEGFRSYARIYGLIPLHKEELKALNLAKLQLQECILAVEKGQDTGIDQKLTNVEATLESISDKAENLTLSYFKDYEKWEETYQAAKEQAKRKGGHLILIDKFDRTCKVYQGADLRASFPIELGPNWIGDKKQAGDKTTPEGIYKILMKKEGGQTKFYKALLLNYPNEEDLKRYQGNKRSGIIPKNALVGGDIEIHGMGLKGSDWTDGCIALSNEDMDQLYQMIAINTPVVIVGSTQALDVILSK